MLPPSAPRIRASLRLIVVMFALFVGACGFQPRGQTAGVGIPEPLFISGINPYSALYRELEQRLKDAGVGTAAGMADSAAVLDIARWKRDSRLLSVNSRNRAVEFELEELAQFTLRTREGRELVGPQTVSVTRIQFRPETAVLGSSREAELLRGDMVGELADRIVRRLAAQQ